MGIPEFVELNLSQVEFEKGISVNDETWPKFAFTSRYDVNTPESWKNDFIDLDAFIGNVHHRLIKCATKGDCMNTAVMFSSETDL